ncbi:Glu-tRNA(Gln) amidotransferase GatDE subunit E, partial [Candidatus Woesearchaeota archaeon CG10_big_fil_rev_8_21_14_0_10_47_5]
VEIKGAQDLHILQKLIETECIRQLRLINIKKMLESGNIKPKAYDIKDITAILKTSNSRLVSKAISDRGVALAVKLEGFKGILGSEAQPNRRFGSELADYARVSANVGGIIHSDELPGYGITDEHINKIIKLLSCNERDGFVIVLDARHKAERALRAVIGRVKAAFLGVPEEVRRAYPDSSTSFLRPMPGAARMYPETDIPPIPITADLISSIKLPELISETADRLASVGISRDLAEQLSRSNKAELFDDLCAEYRNVDPGFIASTLVLAPKEIKTRLKLDSSLITDEAVDKILGYLDSGIIGKDAVFEMLCEVASGKKPRPEDYRVLSDEELREAVKDVISQNKDAPPKALIGKVMSRLRGRADGKRIALIVKENFE